MAKEATTARRVKCPLPAYKDAWVELPPEWLGEHLLKRDQAVRASLKLNNSEITMAAISLCIVEDWGGIPGLTGKDPAGWDFTKVPLPLLTWLEQAVFDSFKQAFSIPKASSSSPPAG